MTKQELLKECDIMVETSEQLEQIYKENHNTTKSKDNYGTYKYYRGMVVGLQEIRKYIEKLED